MGAGWAKPGAHSETLISAVIPQNIIEINIFAPWFAYWLHGNGPRPDAEAWTFQTGSNVWKKYELWPPKQGINEKKLYFRENGALSFDAPSGADGFDSYVSDPANPVPYRPRPITPHIPEKTGPSGCCRTSGLLNTGLMC